MASQEDGREAWCLKKIQEEKRAEDAGMLSLEAETRSELWHTGDPHTQTEEGTAVTARLTLGICPGRC